MSANSEAISGAKMNDEPVVPKDSWWCLQWLIVGVIVILGLGLLIPSGSRISPVARMMQASSNCRQILISLKSYAGDHDGRYPDGNTANEAFRELFKAGLLEDERAFTVSSSLFEPDNNIGDPPNYEEALVPGENHWAMTRGLKESDSGNTPLVFENPVRAEWPPRWNMDVAGQRKEGRAWKTGKIIIGRNDGSVAVEQLNATHGPEVPLKPDSTGKDLFEQAGPHEVLNIAR
jgi:hypothetical protein